MKTLLQERTYTLLFTIIVTIIISTIIYPQLFATVANAKQIMLNLSIETIVSAGMMLLMIAGKFDLSVGSVVAFAGGLAAHLMFFNEVNVVAAVAIALAASAAIGLINGYFIAYIGINPMIQTLAMMGIVRGLSLMVSGAGIQNLPYWFNAIGQSRLLGLQMPIWYMLFIIVLFSLLLSKSFFFRKYYYIGSNAKAARFSGIQVNKGLLWSFIIASLLAGIAGILITSRLGAAMSTSGKGLELRAITAVILGGASLSGGQGKMIGALLGTVFIGLTTNVMVIARVSGYWQEIILGLILIAAICIDLAIKQKISKA